MLPWKHPIPTPESAQFPTYVTDVGQEDVLMGRGTPSVKHTGNKFYRQMIDEKKVCDLRRFVNLSVAD